MSIGNHSDDPVDIKQLIEDVAKEPDSGALVLALADAYAAQGEWLHALQHYNTCTGLEDRGVRKWYALYQAARMLEKLDFSPQLITEAYFAAFDHYPEKIEPLVQIARHCRLAGQLTTALDIIQMAMEAESPDCNYYYEPETWAFGRGIEFLRICIALNDKDRALGIADELLAGGQLPTMAESLVWLLRLQVSDPAQARTVLGLSDDAASDEKTVPDPADDNPPANIPEATPKGPPRRLCIGMATFDDYDGVYFSVQALRMYHPEILDQIQILIIDNNPAGAAAEKLKELDCYIPNYRYVPESKVVGTAIRDRIFQESNAEFVLVMDCHVFIVPGALARLLEYLDAHPDSPDLLQGPLLHDDLRTISTHFAPG
ncbi:MAG: glycosyltransferase family 2 protein, partial [Gammaproteobacteria bacterium]|nr:glycosyltransferase family 2 protein [Gammaproteobacteria bacterium]